MRYLIFVAAFALLSTKGHAHDSYEVTLEHDVTMKTRDGVTLRADIFRPKADGKFPVLLNRNPYNKYRYIAGPVYLLGPDPISTAARGYVLIIQDARGKYASEGDWYPFKYEAQDTYDTVEWAAALPYSNGKVGMIGVSYVGVPQMLGAVAAPPHLVAIFPGVTGSNYHDNWIYQGGAFCFTFSSEWAAGFAVDDVRRRAESTIPRQPYYDSKRPPAENDWSSTHGTGEATYYADWVAHPAYDDYWKRWSIEESYSRIQVPALHVAGWYDLFLGGGLKNYQGIKNHGGSEAARKGQRLIIIPGGHSGNDQKIGEVDFGNSSVFDLWGYGLRWLDWVMKGVDNGMAQEKPVKIFVMGKNVWRDEDDWPLARAKTTRYFLHSQGKANSSSGDGGLSTLAPASEPSDSYIFDPDDPVPTYGGMNGSQTAPLGPVDQRSIESRQDVLVYSTPAFENDTEVTGPVSVELYVSSSAPDTDFTGRLIDVSSSGVALNLAEGILRARYRNSPEKAELMKPGEIYKLTIDLWATSNVFLAGHKLRVEIASSNYPRFDLNPNTGESPETATIRVKASNVIHHDRAHPSALIVPIVP